MKVKLKPYMTIILILCILVGIYFLWPIITDESDSVLVEGAIDGNSSISTVEQTSHKPIAYITGAVVSPGLYEFESSATVGDVVQLAGGLLPYADVESVNMAKSVNAGDHIHIVFNFHGNPEVLLRGNKININTATAKELDSLPGIGPAMAKRIEEATGIETRATILGHMQRGGSPTCKDRVYASTMGALAVDLLCEGKSNRVIGYQDGKYVDFDIDQALSMKKTIPEYQYKIAKSFAI